MAILEPLCIKKKVRLPFSHLLTLLMETPAKRTVNNFRDFPGGPVVRNLPCNAGDAGSIPGRGTNTQHAAGQLSSHTTTTESTCPSQSLCAKAKDPTRRNKDLKQPDKYFLKRITNKGLIHKDKDNRGVRRADVGRLKGRVTSPAGKLPLLLQGGWRLRAPLVRKAFPF